MFSSCHITTIMRKKHGGRQNGWYGMRIALSEIQNFRKLKSCRIEFGDKETVFVGANNSGKTSAMDALILFLKNSRRNEISTTDFTISNWNAINSIGKTWIDCKEPEKLNLGIEQWLPVLPAVDIWLDVDNSEIHYVIDLIPTLSWQGGNLGVRLCLEPKNIEELYKEFKRTFDAATETVSKKKSGSTNLSLWPQSLKDFLERHLQKHFTIKTKYRAF